MSVGRVGRALRQDRAVGEGLRKMTDDAAETSAKAVRAGFWRRVTAFGVDMALVSVLFAAVGLALTGLTGGTARIAGSTIVDARDCIASAPVPSDFTSVEIAFRCTRSVFGLAHDWTQEKMLFGGDGNHRWRVETPLDAQGRPATTFYMDDLIPLVFAAYFVLLEWRFGATLGKRITGVAVHSLDGRPMSFMQAVRRMLVRLAVLVCVGVFDFYSTTSTDINPPRAEAHQFLVGIMVSPRMAGLGMPSQALKLLVLACFASFVAATLRGKQPLHDWLAGTEAVRRPSKSAAGPGY